MKPRIALLNDVCRCLGLLPAPMGEIACMRRQTCARYLQRHQGGPRTPFAQWLCPTEDHYYGSYIEEKA